MNLMQAKRNLAIVITLMVFMIPITADSQTDWVARNIYALNQSIGYGMAIDYNMTNHELRVLLVHNGMATENIGLAILEIVFGVNSIPNTIDAYLIIDEEPVKYQDQLINWSISPVTWTFPNETEISAYYAYAYIYLFENQSITNETTQRPYFEQNVFNESAYVTDSSVVLADATTTASVEEQPVYVDYLFGSGFTGTIIVIVGVGIGIGVLILMLVLWSRRK